jgi:glycosyltransferase involved in cell wall biosynthesis
MPNRYGSYRVEGSKEETGKKYRIDRLTVPLPVSGTVEQARAFTSYYKGVMNLIKKEHYDMVFASSSRLFTAFLGKRCAVKNKCPLYLDIRDIFVDNMKEILKGKKYIQIPLVWALGLIEKYTFKNADHINLISGGFRPYFEKYEKPAYSEYTNGIDDMFIEAGKESSVIGGKPYVITYAGNMGRGQGLEKVIPEAAKQLGADYKFHLIGDGGTRKLLEEKLKNLGVDNVELSNPVARKELIQYYRESTFLFFHLNDLEAFKKVLPSKMFVYGAFDKPIIAGVGGYAAQFVEKNIPNHILFNPTEVDDFVNQLRNYQLKFEHRDDFIKNFSRKSIDKELAASIVGLLKK